MVFGFLAVLKRIHRIFKVGSIAEQSVKLIYTEVQLFWRFLAVLKTIRRTAKVGKFVKLSVKLLYLELF